MTQGRVCARKPNVPPGMARLAALITKAELVELVWDAFGIGETAMGMPKSSTFDRLVTLVMAINGHRRLADPGRLPLDASKLGGVGVAELREACGEALRLDAGPRKEAN